MRTSDLLRPGEVRLEERFGRKPPKPAVEARVTAFGVHGSRKAKDVEVCMLQRSAEIWFLAACVSERFR